MLTRLNATIKEVIEAIEAYRFNDAANSIYQFIWHELCDWYVELIKQDLKGENGNERKKTAEVVLLKVLQDCLKLLHPMMPFITEEVWDVLPREAEVGSQESEVRSIMQQPFPKAGEDYPDAERNMIRIMDVIRAIRNIRSEMRISPAATIETICYTDDEQMRKLLTSHEGYIKGLAKVSHLKVSAPAERPENAATAIAANVEIFVPLKGLINFDEEEKRLAKDIEKIIKEVEAVQKKLSNRDFLDRAPKEVVTKEQTRVEELLQKKEKLEEGWKRVKILRQN
jgi:valyl-tRNA synthetase